MILWFRTLFRTLFVLFLPEATGCLSTQLLPRASLPRLVTSDSALWQTPSQCFVVALFKIQDRYQGSKQQALWRCSGTPSVVHSEWRGSFSPPPLHDRCSHWWLCLLLSRMYGGVNILLDIQAWLGKIEMCMGDWQKKNSGKGRTEGKRVGKG